MFLLLGHHKENIHQFTVGVNYVAVTKIFKEIVSNGLKKTIFWLEHFLASSTFGNINLDFVCSHMPKHVLVFSVRFDLLFCIQVYFIHKKCCHMNKYLKAYM